MSAGLSRRDLFPRVAAPSGFRPGRGALRGLKPTDGVLAAMKATDAAGKHVADLSVASAVGTTYSVEWVPVPDRDGQVWFYDPLARLHVRHHRPWRDQR
jgi:hypothetical protein